MRDRSTELSFVVPVFNTPLEILRATLSSIAAQTDRRWECVLVDDASTEPTVVPELDRWAASDGRFRVIRHDANGGIAAATNTGVDAAAGAIVAFVDHDDIVLPDAVAAVLAHFGDNPDDDLVYTDECLVDAAGDVLADYGKPDYSPIRHLGQHYLCHLVAVRRAAIGGIRVRSEFEPAQDVDFLLRVIEAIHERGRGVGHIPRVLYHWRAVEGSVALRATEKRGTDDAVLRCVSAAAARRGIEATATIVVHDGAPTTSVRLTFPAPDDDDIEVADLRTVTPAELATLIATTPRSFVHLTDGSFDPADARAVAAEAGRGGVGIAGPCLVGRDGRLVSAGRLVSPTLHDAFAGDELGPGPWGSFFVTREVSAVAPVGAVVAVAAARGVGGLATDVGFDAGLAELSERMRRAGHSTVWSPACTVVVEPGPHLPLHPSANTDADDWAVCRRRLGGVSERYDTVGIAHHRDPVVPPILRARELIATGAVDLVTSDVFDTIVSRPAATPSDVFVTLGRELSADGLVRDVEPRQFAAARVAAEGAARQAVLDGAPGSTRAPECTLEQIWAAMPATWFDDVDRMVARELDLEARLLRPIAPALAALRCAHDRGIDVVLVSDTYLSAEQLDRVLRGCGVDTGIFTRIVTSSDHHMGKADGLLAMAIADAGCEPARTLHLGDNPDADIATAEELGATAIQVELERRALHVGRSAVRGLVEYSRVHGTDGGVSAATRAQLIAVGALAHHPSYQFGAVAAGPALAGFARWVGATASRLGAPAVHYLLREGATIAELVATVVANPAPARLVHASRWVDMRAAVVEGSATELHEALARRGPTTVGHVADAFGIDPDRVRELWQGADAHDPATLRGGCARLADDPDVRQAICAAAADLRKRVVCQIVDEIHPDALAGTAPLVVCDVGWGATIQSGLERIVRAEGYAVDVVGLYFALSTPGEVRAANGMRVHAYLPSDLDAPHLATASRAISHHADTVERLLMPPTGTLLDIDRDGQPLLSTDLDLQPPSLLIAKRGVSDVVAEIARNGFDDTVWVDDIAFRGALASTLASAITQPGQRLAAELTAWPHDDVAGSDPQPVGGTVSSSLLPYVTIRELDMLRRSERAWLEGAAAVVNPLLALQIEAERAGVDADRLAPGAAAGPSRLAAFPIGSDLAVLHIEHHLGVAADGWSALRLSGSFGTLRSVRFDAATEPALVEIGRLTVTLTDQEGTADERTIDNLEGSDLDWVDAWPTSPSRYVSTPGGYLIVPIGPGDGGQPGHLDVVVVFRRWTLEEGDPLLRPGLTWTALKTLRRARRAAARRLS